MQHRSRSGQQVKGPRAKRLKVPTSAPSIADLQKQIGALTRDLADLDDDDAMRERGAAELLIGRYVTNRLEVKGLAPAQWTAGPPARWRRVGAPAAIWLPPKTHRLAFIFRDCLLSMGRYLQNR